MTNYRTNLLIGINDLKHRAVKPLSRDRFIYFSIKNCKSENHRTFRIKKQPNESKFAPGRLVLELLIGPDNDENYLGLSFINVDHIQVWNKYLNSKNAELCILVGQKIFGFAGRYNQSVLDTYNITPDGNCFRCGKHLTDPISVESGYGEVCRGKLGL